MCQFLFFDSSQMHGDHRSSTYQIEKVPRQFVGRGTSLEKVTRSNAEINRISISLIHLHCSLGSFRPIFLNNLLVLRCSYSFNIKLLCNLILTSVGDRSQCNPILLFTLLLYLIFIFYLFLLFLPWLPFHIYLVVIEQQ